MSNTPTSGTYITLLLGLVAFAAQVYVFMGPIKQVTEINNRTVDYYAQEQQAAFMQLKAMELAETSNPEEIARINNRSFTPPSEGDLTLMQWSDRQMAMRSAVIPLLGGLLLGLVALLMGLKHRRRGQVGKTTFYMALLALATGITIWVAFARPVAEGIAAFAA